MRGTGLISCLITLESALKILHASPAKPKVSPNSGFINPERVVDSEQGHS